MKQGQPMKASLRDICDSLARQNVEQHQALLDAFLHLGIYQSAMGPLPQNVVEDVVNGLNAKKEKAATANMFLRDVREIAAQLAAKAKEQASEAPSHSPYMSHTDVQGSRQSAFGNPNSELTNSTLPTTVSPLIVKP